MNLEINERIERALALASRLHRNQQRKGSGVPYLSHLLGVASIVLEYMGSEDEAIAALLHDAVEDQGGKPILEMIQSEFGANVADIVAGCSDSFSTPKPPWRVRKEEYLEHLVQAPRSVRFVSAADKLHNARCILADYRKLGETLWDRFRGGRDGTLWYYHRLVEIFKQLDPSPLTDELARVVEELDRLIALSSDTNPDVNHGTK